MRFMLVAVVLALISADCSIVLRYPPSRSWTESVETLGAVTFCRGGFCDGSDEGLQWPIAFKTVPQAEAHYAELAAKAATMYHLSSQEIVLRHVSVSYSTEMDGTIRGWKSSAQAGRLRPQPAALPQNNL